MSPVLGDLSGIEFTPEDLRKGDVDGERHDPQSRLYFAMLASIRHHRFVLAGERGEKFGYGRDKAKTPPSSAPLLWIGAVTRPALSAFQRGRRAMGDGGDDGLGIARIGFSRPRRGCLWPVSTSAALMLGKRKYSKVSPRLHTHRGRTDQPQGLPSALPLSRTQALTAISEPMPAGSPMLISIGLEPEATLSAARQQRRASARANSCGHRPAN